MDGFPILGQPDTGDTAWMLASSALVLLMTPGLAFFYGGMVRAKGGIVFRVQQELGVPVKLVGLGEGPDDLAPFEPEAFVDALLG